MAFQADAVRRPAQQDQEDERIDGKGDDRRPDDAGQAEIKDQDRQQVEDDMTILAATRLYSGVLPSPQLRKMAASKLYSDKKGRPSRKMRRYCSAIS